MYFTYARKVFEYKYLFLFFFLLNNYYNFSSLMYDIYIYINEHEVKFSELKLTN